MLLNTSGFENVANGTEALLNNASGSYKYAVGAFALLHNIDGSSNNANSGLLEFSSVLMFSNHVPASS
jgi:hypothetical protein